MVRAPYPLATWMVAVPDAAGGAVHEHRLALAQVAALGQREVRGQVVHRQRGALVEATARRAAANDRVARGMATSSAAPP